MTATSPPDTSRPDWVVDTVFYQVFPDRFANGDPQLDPTDVQPWGSPPDRDHYQGGDLAGLLDRLADLAELGITGLWLNPIFAAGTNHRYDTHDYRRVDPRLGDEGILKQLVDEAHRLGIRVILDGVFNHCGDGFWAFRDLHERGEASPYVDWFITHDLPLRTDPPNYQTCGGAAYLPKLNTENPEVRRYLLDVATDWIEAAGIDGWRLDVPWKIPYDFWSQLRGAVRSANPDAYLVGEIWRDPSGWLDVFDGTMNYPLRNILLDYCLHDDMDAEDALFELRWLLETCGEAAPWMLNLLGSHDTPRLMTLASGDERRAALAQTALFTLPGVPMIYYGDELGLEGGDDPGCRAAMPVDPDPSQLARREVLKQLIALRRDHPALRRGSFEPLLTFNGVLAYERSHQDDVVVVVLNPREAQTQLLLPTRRGSTSRWRDLLGGAVFSADCKGVAIDRIPETSALLLVPDERTAR